MEEKIKEIVSVFIRIPVGQIGPATPVGRTAVQSSILLHRMYARLREEGLAIDDYTGIKMFGDLLRAAGAGANGQPVAASPLPPNVYHGGHPAGGVGIDIEEINALPGTADFRTETFYIQNFTPREIAYCILQADPYASFAGLFAVKEAIIKADGQFRGLPFHALEIDHSAEGRPTHPGFDLSISHAGGMALAVAVGQALLQPAPVTKPAPPAAAAQRHGGGWIGWIALLLAAAALLIALMR